MSIENSTATPEESTVASAPHLDQILRLAERGWRLHPLKSTRRPFLDGWPERATADPDQIRSWALEYPECNWGVVTGAESGVFGVDVDGIKGAASLEKLEKLYGSKWQETLSVRTARGAHYYFRYPADHEIRNSTGEIAEGIDIRGEGGYLVVPPSVHEDGPAYIWLTAEDAAILEAPAWLLKEIKKASGGKKKSAKAVAGPIPHGQRNSTLASLAGSMRRRRMTFESIAAALQLENQSRCEPPLEASEVQKIAESVAGYEPPTEDEAMPPQYSDDALALAFTERHGLDFRYTAAWDQWWHWDGMAWRKEETLLVFDLARKICRDVALGASERLAPRIASARTVPAVVRLASADRRHAAKVDQWDRNIWLLNTPGGVVDLRTGGMLPHRREDYCSKITTAAPGGACPLWRKFLDRITNSDLELQKFLQRVCGYCLTGVTNEHALFFLYGTGANGKSVLLETISGILLDYATHAPIETFMLSHNERHPTDLAGLMGARLVTANETRDGRWDETKLKQFTGGEKIKARFMRQDFFEYVPQCKILIAGNNRPSLSKVDEAIRRRFHLIPFAVTIPADQRDSELAQKLRGEWGGILSWMIEGCRMWQKEGLNPPPVVLSATDEYLASEDALGAWIEECCMQGQNDFETVALLFDNWESWAESNNDFVGTKKRFSQHLKERGFEAGKDSAGRRGFKGIKVKTDF